MDKEKQRQKDKERRLLLMKASKVYENSVCDKLIEEYNHQQRFVPIAFTVVGIIIVCGVIFLLKT